MWKNAHNKLFYLDNFSNTLLIYLFIYFFYYIYNQLKFTVEHERCLALNLIF